MMRGQGIDWKDNAALIGAPVLCVAAPVTVLAYVAGLNLAADPWYVSTAKLGAAFAVNLPVIPMEAALGVSAAITYSVMRKVPKKEKDPFEGNFITLNLR
jgi:hypothetical protein